MSGEIVKQLLDEGEYSPADIRTALGETASAEEVDTAMLEGYQPTVDQLKTEGFTDDEINEVLISEGVITAPSAPAPGVSEQPLDSPGQLDTPGALHSWNVDGLVSKEIADKVNAPVIPGTEPTFEQKTPEHVIDMSDMSPKNVAGNLRKIQAKYNLGKNVASLWDDSAKQELDQDERNVNSFLVSEMRKRGFDASISEEGTLQYTTQEGYQEEATEAWWKGVLRSSSEIGFSVTGAIKGANWGKQFGPYGAAAGGVLFGAVGAGGGNIVDNVFAAYQVKYDIDLQRVFTNAVDAMDADVTLGIVGTAAMKGTVNTIKAMKGWTLAANEFAKNKGVYKGTAEFLQNVKGAYKAFEDFTNLSKSQIDEIIGWWEHGSGQTAQGTDVAQAARAYVETQKGGDVLLRDALGKAKTSGSKLRHIVQARTDDLLQETAKITNDNIAEVIPHKLNEYVIAVADDFQATKDAGIALIDESDKLYSWDFDELIPKETFDDIGRKLVKYEKIKEFEAYMEQMKALGQGSTSPKTDALAAMLNTKSDIAGIKTAKKGAIASGKKAKLEKVVTTKAQDLKLKKDIGVIDKRILALDKKIETDLGRAKTNTTDRARLAAAERASVSKAKKKALQSDIRALRSGRAEAKGAEGLETAETAVASGKEQEMFSAQELKASKQLKVQEGELPQVQELENPNRKFANLLELRNIVNDFRSDSSLKAATGAVDTIKILKGVINNIDKEIKNASTNYMVIGSSWQTRWQGNLIEYSKMKALEKNSLYKALASPEVDANIAVRALTSKILKPGIFKSVMGKLPERMRDMAEGAVLNHMTELSAGKNNVIDFVGLDRQLAHMSFTTPAARSLKRTINDFAKVYKNDPAIMSVLRASSPGVKESTGFATSATGKAKMGLLQESMQIVRSMIPFTTDGQRRALTKQITKIVDNPLNVQTVKEIEKLLPADHTLNHSIKRYALEYVKHGEKENYKKAPIYAVSKLRKARVSDTPLGRGTLYNTDKEVMTKAAKETKSKLVTYEVPPSLIITPEELSAKLGRQVTPADYKDKSFQIKLMDEGFLGVTDGEKVLIFD